MMAEAKKLQQKEKIAQEDKEMKEIIKSYEGKCFGTSKFRQKSKSVYHKAIHIQKIERLKEHKHATAEGTIVCYYQQVYCAKSQELLYSKTRRNNNINFSIGNYTTHLNNGSYNMYYNMHNLTQGMKEISYSTFQELLSAGEIANQVVEDGFSGRLQFEVEKTMGDSGDQTRFEEACGIAKVELIDLEKHLPLLDAIRYAHLPGYVEDRYLIKRMAKLALETQIKINEKRMQDRWLDVRRYQAFERENNTIKEYITNLKL